MQIQNLFKPFEIEFFQVDNCPCTSHKHTFFEMVYIISGSGVYHINKNKFNYTSENLFLIMPNDEHRTTVTSTTAFLFIRFNNIYLNSQKPEKNHSNLGEWVQKLEYVLQNSNQLSGSLISIKTDRPLIKAICNAIVQEFVNQKIEYKELLQQLIT